MPAEIFLLMGHADGAGSKDKLPIGMDSKERNVQIWRQHRHLEKLREKDAILFSIIY